MSQHSLRAVRMTVPDRTDERLAHTTLMRSYSTALFGSAGRMVGIGDGSSATFSGSVSLQYSEESSESDSDESLGDTLRLCAAGTVDLELACFLAATLSFFTSGSRAECHGSLPFSADEISDSCGQPESATDHSEVVALFHFSISFSCIEARSLSSRECASHDTQINAQ